MNNLYKFRHSLYTSDQFNPQGKVTKYLEVNVIANSEDNARIKAKLDQEYTLIDVKELGEGWD